MFAPNPWIRHDLDSSKACIHCGKLFHQADIVAYTNKFGMTIIPHPEIPLDSVLSCQGGLS